MIATNISVMSIHRSLLIYPPISENEKRLPMARGKNHEDQIEASKIQVHQQMGYHKTAQECLCKAMRPIYPKSEYSYLYLMIFAQQAFGVVEC